MIVGECFFFDWAKMFIDHIEFIYYLCMYVYVASVKYRLLVITMPVIFCSKIDMEFIDVLFLCQISFHRFIGFDKMLEL